MIDTVRFAPSTPSDRGFMGLFGDLISARIDELRITRREAARRCGMPSHAKMNDIINEPLRDFPKPLTLERLAVGLGIPRKKLIDTAVLEVFGFTARDLVWTDDHTLVFRNEEKEQDEKEQGDQ